MVAYLPVLTVYAPSAAAQIPEPVQRVEVPPEPPPVVEDPLPDSVLCNCWAYLKEIYPTLPNTKEIHANLQKNTAEVAVFSYDGLNHYAHVVSVGTSTFSVEETNFKKCTKGSRIVQLSDPRLLGFYNVTE